MENNERNIFLLPHFLSLFHSIQYILPSFEWDLNRGESSIWFIDFLKHKMEVLRNWFPLNDRCDKHKLLLQHTWTYVNFLRLPDHNTWALSFLFASFRDYTLDEMTSWMEIPSLRSIDTIKNRKVWHKKRRMRHN